MRAGSYVVSADKQLLLQHGDELSRGARAPHRLRFEAAVAACPGGAGAGGVTRGDADRRIHGIVNGTTNYILREMARRPLAMTSTGGGAAPGLRGGGSADDVNGRDAAAKMALLARLAFGAPVAWRMSATRASNSYAATIWVRARAGARPEADRHGRARGGGAVGAGAPGVSVFRASAFLGVGTLQRDHG